MTQSILVITYENETDNCSLKRAHDIAAPLAAKIDAVRFIKTNGSILPDEATIQAQSQALTDSLDTVFADYKQKQLIKSQVVVTDDIVKWVTDYCDHADNDFDLVIKAGHRTETLFHTPCDWKLIRSLQIPVLIASQQHWRKKHTVLAAIDPTAKDEAHQALNCEILQWTKKWAQAFDCSIHLVYCLPVPKILKELDIIDLKKYASTHKAESEEKLLALIEKHELPNAVMHVTAGSPEKAIPHCADKLKAELVLMGSVGKRGFTSNLVGNISEKAIHNLRTDSLVLSTMDSQN